MRILYSETAMLNFDMPAFYTNFLRDIRDSQEADGSVPDTVPRARFARGAADPAWGSAYPLIVLYIYQRYGDRRVLEENFDGIAHWTDFLNSHAKDGTLDEFKFGDWVPVEPTPGPLVSTFYLYWSADITARAAEVLGRTEEAAAVSRAGGCGEGRDSETRFFRPRQAEYGNGSQTSNILPLFAGHRAADRPGHSGG